MPTEEPSLSDLLSRLLDQSLRLFSNHLSLFREELTEDAKTLGAGFAFLLAASAFLLLGYGFLCFSAAQVLETRYGTGVGYLAIGGLNLLLGGFGVWQAAARLRGRNVLEVSRNELNRSTSFLSRRGDESNG